MKLRSQPKESEENSTKGNETQTDISEIDRFIGNYSSPLYGMFDISSANESLEVTYGRLLKGTLSYHKDDLFNLTVLEPLKPVMSTDITVKFENFIAGEFQRIRLGKQIVFDRMSSVVNLAEQFNLSLVTFLVIILCSLSQLQL